MTTVATNFSGGASILGDTSGNAVPAGYVGEKITWASAPSTQSVTTSYADWTNASITLTAGVWLVQANINCIVTSGTTAGNDGELQIRITDSSNNVLQNLEKILRVKTPANAETINAGCLNFSGIFNYSTSSNVLKIRIRMNNVNGTNSGTVYNAGTVYSEFFAIRIA